MEGKTIVFNGETYIRSPKSRYYFKYTTHNSERRNANQLHRAVWEYYNGKIPAGYQVHHIDGNVDNNDISNLACMTRQEHLAYHAGQNKLNPEYIAQQKESIKKAKEAAKKWHSSVEGKDWHRRHVEESIGKLEENRIKKVCAYCGKQFDGMPWSRYCSDSCADKARRRKKGLKFTPHEIHCLNCGDAFIAQKVNTKFCCEKCKRTFYREQKNTANE